MLELAGLLIGPWVPWEDAGGTSTLTGPGPARAVLDAVSRARVGLVRQRARTWPGWLGRKELVVCEAEDESLLCTVRGPWLLSWAWEVHDAEERRVAVVRGPEILDGFGRPLALLQPAAMGRAGKLLEAGGKELGEWAVREGETLLQFSSTLTSEPLVKMALLGVLLSQV